MSSLISLIAIFAGIGPIGLAILFFFLVMNDATKK